MQFHLLVARNASPLYKTEEEARHRLLCCRLALDAMDCRLLDFSLTTHRFLALVGGPLPAHACQRLPFGDKLSEVALARKNLLEVYGLLACGLPQKARDYRLCGTYEAYHGSQCFCLLGKTEQEYDLPPLSEILTYKRRLNALSCAGRDR